MTVATNLHEDEESKPIDIAKRIQRSLSNVFETNDEQFQVEYVERLHREDDELESIAVDR